MPVSGQALKDSVFTLAGDSFRTERQPDKYICLGPFEVSTVSHHIIIWTIWSDAGCLIFRIFGFLLNKSKINHKYILQYKISATVCLPDKLITKTVGT